MSGIHDSLVQNNQRIYILLRDDIANKKERTFTLSRHKTHPEVNVLRGSIWKDASEYSVTNQTAKKLSLASVEFDNVSLTTHYGNVKCITGDEYELLIAIATLEDRHHVFVDGNWLAEGMTLKNNDVVYLFRLNGLPEKVVGKVRHVGNLPDCKGTWFGVELSLEYDGLGTSDGTFKGTRYFSCKPNCAVFKNISHIRLCTDSSLFKEHRIPPIIDRTKKITRSVPLDFGERVVWLSDTGPEYGVVRWIGILPDANEDEITIGVEFDNPVGTGTGRYSDQQLFRAPHNHASLIPLMGLMKASDMRQAYDMPAPPYAAITNTVRLPDHPVARGPGFQHNHTVQQYGGRVAEARKPSENMDMSTLSMVKRETGKSQEELITEQNELLRMCSSNARQKSPTPEGATVNHNSEPVSKREAPVGREWKVHHPPEPVENAEVTDMMRSSLQTINPRDLDTDLEIGSVVEVRNMNLYGVIRWIGKLAGKEKPIAGLELEEENSAGTDGYFKGEQVFVCPPKKALFIYLSQCIQDSRFTENPKYLDRTRSLAFGTMESPEIHGNIGPPKGIEDVTPFIGKNKGIQGHHNSCYLDATLFSMFAFTQVFDTILFRPHSKYDIPEYGEVQNVLKEAIVNPLRTHFFVRADKVLKLRTLLDKLSSIEGLMSEEKDPEEFLTSLLEQIMKADPLIRLNSGNESYLFQLFIEKDERIVLPSTQQLLELSCLQSNIKLSEAPSCLILQMPRFGKDYKMYERIVPSLELDITDVLERGPRNCAICGSLARYECQQCYKQYGDGLDKIAFCEGCNARNHHHAKRAGHHPMKLNVVPEYVHFWQQMKDLGRDVHIPREKMELFAVVCIQTSHYVAFVKCGSGPRSPWVFFDSMADRMGEQHGYNIPEVKPCPDLTEWLSDEGTNKILEVKDDKQLPEQMRRLLCDGYMCMYQSPQLMMYK